MCFPMRVSGRNNTSRDSGVIQGWMAGIMTLFGSFLLLPVAQAGKPLPTGFFELRQASDTAQKVAKSIAWQRTDVTGVAIRVTGARFNRLP